MKKFCFLLALILLLSLGVSAFAENAVVIIIMDGVPVVVESFTRESGSAETLRNVYLGFAFPAALAAIEESAFEGIPAEYVEITENVTFIGARAFADCINLREIVIPATVKHIDDSALEGSGKVTVYGEAGSEAQRFATDNDIPFVAMEAADEPEIYEAARTPVILPYIALG